MNGAFPIEDILNAFRCGLFAMADGADSPTFNWYSAKRRGQILIEGMHVPDRLRRTVLREPFDIRIDTDFAGVIDGCAAPRKRQQRTWINHGIRDMFCALHEAGHAHSVECWRDGALVGGVYGLALGGVFCAESMFSTARDASKVALVHLAARLWKGGFAVLDTQLVNDHLTQFGVYEIPHDAYLALLAETSGRKTDFRLAGQDEAALVRDWLAHRN